MFWSVQKSFSHITYIHLYYKMSKVLLHFRKWQRLTTQYIQTLNPKLDHLIDKYKLIKYGCILGAGTFLPIQP